jgi:hypothetical protein
MQNSTAPSVKMAQHMSNENSILQINVKVKVKLSLCYTMKVYGGVDI